MPQLLIPLTSHTGKCTWLLRTSRIVLWVIFFWNPVQFFFSSSLHSWPCSARHRQTNVKGMLLNYNITYLIVCSSSLYCLAVAIDKINWLCFLLISSIWKSCLLLWTNQHYPRSSFIANIDSFPCFIFPLDTNKIFIGRQTSLSSFSSRCRLWVYGNNGYSKHLHPNSQNMPLCI